MPASAAKAATLELEFPPEQSIGELWVLDKQDRTYLCDAKSKVKIDPARKLCLKLNRILVSPELGKYLSAMPRNAIYEVDASSCEISQETVADIARIKGLRSLDIGYSYDASRPKPESYLPLLIARFAELDSLALHGWKVTNQITTALPASLRSVDLSDDTVDDSSLKTLSQLSRLTVLSLSRTNVGAEGLRYLGQCKSLKRLELSYTSLDDAAVCELVNLPFLELLDIRGVELSPKEVSTIEHSVRVKNLLCDSFQARESPRLNFQLLLLQKRDFVNATKTAEAALSAAKCGAGSWSAQWLAAAKAYVHYLLSETHTRNGKKDPASLGLAENFLRSALLTAKNIGESALLPELKLSLCQCLADQHKYDSCLSELDDLIPILLSGMPRTKTALVQAFSVQFSCLSAKHSTQGDICWAEIKAAQENESWVAKALYRWQSLERSKKFDQCIADLNTSVPALFAAMPRVQVPLQAALAVQFRCYRAQNNSHQAGLCWAEGQAIYAGATAIGKLILHCRELEREKKFDACIQSVQKLLPDWLKKMPKTSFAAAAALDIQFNCLLAKKQFPQAALCWAALKALGENRLPEVRTFCRCQSLELEGKFDQCLIESNKIVTKWRHQSTQKTKYILEQALAVQMRCLTAKKRTAEAARCYRELEESKEKHNYH